MDKSKLIEGNKIIAQFMGYTYYPSTHIPSTPRRGVFVPGWKKKEWSSNINKFNIHMKEYLCRNHNELVYDTSWNWLMPVISKIKKENDIETLKEANLKITTLTIFSDILLVWQAVIDFIKWQCI